MLIDCVEIGSSPAEESRPLAILPPPGVPAPEGDPLRFESVRPAIPCTAPTPQPSVTNDIDLRGYVHEIIASGFPQLRRMDKRARGIAVIPLAPLIACRYQMQDVRQSASRFSASSAVDPGLACGAVSCSPAFRSRHYRGCRPPLSRPDRTHLTAVHHEPVQGSFNDSRIFTPTSHDQWQADTGRCGRGA